MDANRVPGGCERAETALETTNAVGKKWRSRSLGGENRAMNTRKNDMFNLRRPSKSVRFAHSLTILLSVSGMRDGLVLRCSSMVSSNRY